MEHANAENARASIAPLLIIAAGMLLPDTDVCGGGGGIVDWCAARAIAAALYRRLLGRVQAAH